VERIVAAVSRLESHPRSGRVVPEAVTSCFVKSSRATTIVYRLNPDINEIVTVFHGARLFRNL
jgi:plasmid stabilization system protein ParE